MTAALTAPTRDANTLAKQTALIVAYLRRPNAGWVPVCLPCGRVQRCARCVRQMALAHRWRSACSECFRIKVCPDCGGAVFATDQEAGAVASPGWRPVDWSPDTGPCVAEDCAASHDHSPHPRWTPRWQAEVDGGVDRWPRVLVVRLPELLAELNPVDREIVEQVGRGWASYRHVARAVGLDDHTVRSHYDAALMMLAMGLWDNDGAARWG